MFPNRILAKADEIADNSNCTHKMSCIITDKRGKILSFGSNLQKTHPIQKRYAKRAKQKNKVFLHSEINALIKCKKQPHTAYILRKMKNGYGLAKPCSICMAALEEAGIKQIIYTDYNGFRQEYI